MSAYGYRDGYAPRRHTDDRRPRDSEERHREHGDSRSRAPASSWLAGQLPGPPAAAPESEAPAALPPPPALPPAPAVAAPKPVDKEPPLDRTKVLAITVSVAKQIMCSWLFVFASLCTSALRRYAP